MVAAEDPGLDVEQLLRDPQVLDQVGGEGIQILEHGREDPGPGPDDRVRRVADVERHRPVVGVHRDLDAVAQVVERAAAEAGRLQRRGVESLGMREAVRDRVRILDVDQAPVAVDDEVRILVVVQEWGDHREPVAQRAMEEELAPVGDLVADEQVEVAEAEREQEPVEGRPQRDAGRARPAGHRAGVATSFALAGREVELLLARARDDVLARALPEVDARLGDLRRPVGGDRRQVADEQARLPLVRHLVDRDHRGADAVRVDDALVDESDGGRVLVQRELPG